MANQFKVACCSLATSVDSIGLMMMIMIIATIECVSESAPENNNNTL